MNSHSKPIPTPKEYTENELAEAFSKADSIITKSYLKRLENVKAVSLPETEAAVDVSRMSRLFKVNRLVYDRDENNVQKLANVYSAASATGSNLITLIVSDGILMEYYTGVCDETSIGRLSAQCSSLFNNIAGNFPGSLGDYDKAVLSNEELKLLLSKSYNGYKSVSAVSGIASMRNERLEENQAYFQGIEKLIDTMRGKPFTALFLSNSLTSEGIADIKAEYELLYSALSPFSKSVLSYSDNSADSTTKTLSHSLADTVGESKSTALSVGSTNSTAHTTGGSKGSSDSLGGHAGIGGEIFHAGASYSHSWQRSQNWSDTASTGTSSNETESTGTNKAQTTTVIDSDGTQHTYSVGQTLQLTYDNKAVETLLKQIELQLERLRLAESLGGYATAAYFIALDDSISQMAASTYKSIISGKNTAVEAAQINTWNASQKEEFKKITEALKLFKHPRFKYDGKNSDVTPASIVNAQELAIQVGFPKNSVSGITVLECAAFGRNIYKTDPSEKNVSKAVQIGKLYHMGQPEATPVKLAVDSFAMHTFITGTTGYGKSNTIYCILDSLVSAGVKFLVVESAKGEYKNVFGHRKDVAVYGTNPYITDMLRINPFRFPKAIHVLEHLDRLIEIFNVCWPMYAAMPAILKEAMERAYKAAGWDLRKSVNKYEREIYPTFADIMREVELVLNESRYSSDNKGDYVGALCARLNAMTNGINGMIFVSDDLSDAELFDCNVIVDLSRIGSSETKALIMGLMVLKLQEYRMSNVQAMNSSLKHVTVLEEAHNLLKRTSTEQSSESSNLIGKSVEMLANAIAEMRTFGEGFIIADQSPEMMDLSVIRNTNTKIILNLPDYSDRVLVGKSIGLNEAQIQELAKLRRGVAAIRQNDWIEAVLVQVTRYSANDEALYASPCEYDFSDYASSSLLRAILNKELSGWIDKIDDCSEGDIARLSLPTAIKCKLLEYADARQGSEKAAAMASVAYEFFNTPDVMSRSLSCGTVEDWEKFVIKTLDPSVKEYTENEIRLLLTLLIYEQAARDERFEGLYRRYMEFRTSGESEITDTGRIR